MKNNQASTMRRCFFYVVFLYTTQ